MVKLIGEGMEILENKTKKLEKKGKRAKIQKCERKVRV
jgi:hypothetical protein